MTRNTKYVGLDVHQAMTAATVRTEGGRVLVRSVIETSERSITEFFDALGGAVHAAFEEGTQAQWLYDLLSPRLDRVIVCDVRGQKRSGNKGDRVDADDLSQRLLSGGLRAVYHGSRERADLKELTRAYRNLVEDNTRVMLRLKALFRARAIGTTGGGVYEPTNRAVWIARLPERGARLRAETLYAQLDVLRTQRKKTKAAMVAEAKRDPAWGVLESIPYFGPVRISLLLATIGTPWRFRTKRNLWAYSGLAVVTRSSSEYEMFDGRARRKHRRPLTRGLNRNHNRVLKSVFKGAATTATGKPGPLQDFYHGMLERGMREELARVTLARKLAALTLRLLKTGEVFDPTELTKPQT
jgi:transposase